MTEESSERPAGVLSDVFAGAGMGLLLGVLVGLSSSPVVGVVVGALASVLAVFLGLDMTTGALMGALRVNGARIGSLGLATVVGIGLHVRINNPFREAPAVQLARWHAALPDDPTLAKQMMVLERSGIAPSQFHYGEGAPVEGVEVAAQEGAAARQAVLFSTLGASGLMVLAPGANHAGLPFVRMRRPGIFARASAHAHSARVARPPTENPNLLTSVHRMTVAPHTWAPDALICSNDPAGPIPMQGISRTSVHPSSRRPPLPCARPPWPVLPVRVEPWPPRRERHQRSA